MADVAKILLLSAAIFLVQSVLGANHIKFVKPLPKGVYAFEFDSASVTCIALDSSGSTEPLIISFKRKDYVGELRELVEDDNVFFRNQTQSVGKDTKLFRTMVIRNVTLEYDSLSGGYECHAFAGNMSKNPEDRFAFNVNVIKKNEIPKVTVTPHTQVLKHDEDLTLFCNLTNKGSDGNKLEKMYWFKDDVLLDSLKIEESEKDSLEFPREIKRVGVRNGGIYSCVLEAKLRGVLGHNVSDDAMIRIATWLPKPAKNAKQNLHNVEQKSFKGDNVSFECAAKGFPLEIEWKIKKKNEDTVQACINGTANIRYKIQRHSAYDPYVLTISDVQYSDRGFYYCCLPSNCSDNVKDNCQRFVLRVKDPLGALWPAVGILVEAVLLFVIIFFAGRKEKNKEKRFKRN